MHWELISTLVALLSSGAAGFSAYTLAQARLEVANALLQMQRDFSQMRVDHAEAYSELYIGIQDELSSFKEAAAQARISDREELRAWINGSFMRSKEAVARLVALEERMKEHDRRL